MLATGPATLLHPGDEDSAKRHQIMDGARRVFMDMGFDGASMNEIARVAGVSKGTLYVYFADKSSLFEAIVEQESLQHGKTSFSFDPARGAETVLRDFGRAYIEIVCRPDGGSAVRTVMAIAERMPDVGRRFYENVIALTMRRLATYLEAKVRTNELAINDCELAAAQFMMMCQATLFQPYIFQAKPAPTPAQIATVVESATQVFLARYGRKS
ncbi:TetR/AcrR family transcriptional regulator [Bradyrhizobium sp. G127]|jgi:AcrR family transcriptional regulator|uniref:TetR/AcrR family transcriptional regulator n=1 Tax=Bradyrhizobium sp. G127 TaxID=2904800 RepID=UPI001F17C590|nr:TetR/AcrR family transcriptional regulator [Bradyrhizobium sp. G127]MCF2522558.1 TetR/AcrR family transcriptional regulator [Bradyrhizobium sp. G127]